MHKVLVVAPRNDYHAVAVSWALGRYGVIVNWYDTITRLDSARHSLQFDSGGCAVFLKNSSIESEYKSVWRRRAYPWVGRSMKGADAKFIYLESTAFDHGLLEAQGSINSSFCMNERHAGLRAENKLIQIYEAAQAGLNVPRTLYSQNPEDVRSFLKQDFDTIVKPYIGQIWANASTGALSITAAAPLPRSWHEHEDFSATVALCPAIYQEKIDKSADLRVVVFGQSVVAVEIRSDDASNIDCREAINKGVASGELINLDTDVVAGILRMCKALGINYASIDFAKTEDGQLFFLDLNPAGQFLYVEELAPDSMIIDKFARCLATGGAPDTLKSKNLTLAQFEKSEIYSKFVEDYLSNDNRNANDDWVVSHE